MLLYWYCRRTHQQNKCFLMQPLLLISTSFMSYLLLSQFHHSTIWLNRQKCNNFLTQYWRPMNQSGLDLNRCTLLLRVRTYIKYMMRNYVCYWLRIYVSTRYLAVCPWPYSAMCCLSVEATSCRLYVAEIIIYGDAVFNACGEDNGCHRCGGRFWACTVGRCDLVQVKN